MMNKSKKYIAIAFVVVLIVVVIVSTVGILSLKNKPEILQGQAEATEIRISGKLPGRIDKFLVEEGQDVLKGDTLVVINSPEIVAKYDQVDAIKNGEYVHLYLDSIINWIDANLQCLVARIVKFVCFGLGDDGHFKAYIPATWQFLQFDTGMNPDDSETYGHLIIKW